MANNLKGIELTIKVDGRLFPTSDPKLTGRQIRDLAGASPASEYVLIMIANNSAQSINPERTVDLTKIGANATFRLFKSDRIFSFTVNERSCEWGAPTIGEGDIREVSGIPDDHDLTLDSDGDRLIKEGETIPLSDNGTERFRSCPSTNRPITIIVNTREKTVSAGRLTFAEIVRLAYENPPTGKDVSITATYRKGPKGCPEGYLLEGQDVAISEGMIFNVRATDKS